MTRAVNNGTYIDLTFGPLLIHHSEGHGSAADFILLCPDRRDCPL